MTNPQKAKGSQYERDVVQYLKETGHRWVERAYGAGRQDDRGDITGLPGWVLECKNQKALDFAGWMGEAERERANADAEYAVVVAKRRLKPTSASYVVMTLEQFSRILRELKA